MAINSWNDIARMLDSLKIALEHNSVNSPSAKSLHTAGIISKALSLIAVVPDRIIVPKDRQELVFCWDCYEDAVYLTFDKDGNTEWFKAHNPR